MNKSPRPTVRPFTEADEPALRLLLADEAVMRYLEPPFSPERTRAFLREAGLCGRPLIWAVDGEDGRFIGYVIYHAYDETSMELGWVLARSAWGRGYASALTRLMIERARAAGKALVLECAPEQAATKRIAEKFGFRFCGKSGGCEGCRGAARRARKPAAPARQKTLCPICSFFYPQRP